MDGHELLHKRRTLGTARRLPNTKVGQCYILGQSVTQVVNAKFTSRGNPLTAINNYLITESEVVTGKSQTEALPY